MNYREAGVDIDEANSLVSRIKTIDCYDENIIGGIGHFAAMYDMSFLKSYNHPVLVSCTDGVGTKIKLAISERRLDIIGQDLVAMCVNDLACVGARPLFFLDYYASHKLDKDQAFEVIEGIQKACHLVNICLIGGENAELPMIIQKDIFDVAGFAVGVVEKDKVIGNIPIVEGDTIIGLGSSGPHSNGYTLINNLVDTGKIGLDHFLDNKVVRDLLLEPTFIYINLIQAIQLYDFHIKGIAHITGGGIYDNLGRIVPKELSYSLNTWKWPKIFTYIMEAAGISEVEMLRTFNCGIGLVIIVPHDEADRLIEFIRSYTDQMHCGSLGFISSS